MTSCGAPTLYEWAAGLDRYAPDRIPAGYPIIARWRSGGGAHHHILTTSPTPPEGWVPIEGRPPVRGLDALERLKDYTELDYRVVGGTVEIAIIPEFRGWWIGKKGWKIKTLQRIVGKRIRLVDGVRLEAWFDDDGKPLSNPCPLPKGAFRWICEPPSQGGSIVGGWYAPWTLEREGGEA